MMVVSGGIGAGRCVTADGIQLTVMRWECVARGWCVGVYAKAGGMVGRRKQGGNMHYSKNVQNVQARAPPGRNALPIACSSPLSSLSHCASGWTHSGYQAEGGRVETLFICHPYHSFSPSSSGSE